MKWLGIAVAGALGACCRYALGVAVGARSFPWVTLGINVSGSFLLALLLAGPLASHRDSQATLAVTVGFLGAYTTFSTFSFETVELVRSDRVPTALAYVAASMILGIAAGAAGYGLGRLTSN